MCNWRLMTKAWNAEGMSVFATGCAGNNFEQYADALSNDIDLDVLRNDRPRSLSACLSLAIATAIEAMRSRRRTGPSKPLPRRAGSGDADGSGDVCSPICRFDRGIGKVIRTLGIDPALSELSPGDRAVRRFVASSMATAFWPISVFPRAFEDAAEPPFAPRSHPARSATSNCRTRRGWQHDRIAPASSCRRKSSGSLAQERTIVGEPQSRRAVCARRPIHSGQREHRIGGGLFELEHTGEHN